MAAVSVHGVGAQQCVPLASDLLHKASANSLPASLETCKAAATFST